MHRKAPERYITLAPGCQCRISQATFFDLLCQLCSHESSRNSFCNRVSPGQMPRDGLRYAQKTRKMSSAISIPSASAANGAPRGPWIYGPWLDLAIGCGAWSAPLLLLTNYVSSSSTKGWSFAFYALALLFNYPHFMATVYRAYHSYDEFAKYRVFTVHVTLLLLFAGLIAHLWYPLLPWIFTLYICWSPWHYTGQNYGLLMMFARRAGAAPSDAERRALRLSFMASYVMLMFSFHT